MSFLFHKRTKNVIKWVWIAIAIVIIISMVFAYSGSIEMWRTIAT